MREQNDNRTSDANYESRFVAAARHFLRSQAFFYSSRGRALKRQLKRDTISLGSVAESTRAHAPSRSINCLANNTGDRSRKS